jgi:predicted CXXCH cytochrome family protein
VRGRRMVAVRYEQACAECHPLNVRIVAEPSDAAVRESVEAFCRQPAPHAAPALVSAVLRERLRLLAQQHPSVGMSDPASEPLRSLPGRRPEPLIPRDLAEWVDSQTSKVRQLLFDSAGGCRYCHIAKGDRPEGLAPVEYERTNLPVSWFPYAKFSHAKHGLMACSDCHDQARTSTRTRDVLMPTKQLCVACHSSQGSPRGHARTDCLECHEYHSHSRAGPVLAPTRIQE